MREVLRGKTLAFVFLFIAAILWGSTFVLVQDNIKTSIYFQLAVRFLFASAVFFVAYKGACWRIPKGLGGTYVVLGISVATCFLPQTFGLQGTSVANASVITAMFMVFTPVAYLIMKRRNPKIMQWVGAIIGLMAFVVLGSAQGFTSLNVFDGLIFITAVSVAIHTVLYADVVKDPAGLGSAIFWQFFITALFCIFLHVATEGPSLPTLDSNQWLILLYLGVASTAVPYFLQALAQRTLSPVQVVLVISSEPLWAIGFANILRGDAISGAVLVACAILILANLVAELKWVKSKSVA